MTRKTIVRCRIRGKRPEKKGMVIRRRISGKQRVFARHIALSVAMAPAEVAVRDEAWSELIALQRDAKRKHIHWTQVRTHNAAHKQPSQFTRKGFWMHLKRVYKETYPEVIREWKVVLPIASCKPDFPKCAKCFASFMLDNDAQWHRTRAGAGGGVFL